MKKFILIGLFLVSVSAQAQTPVAYSIMPRDSDSLDNADTFENAQKRCASQNERLPTVAELKSVLQTTLDSKGHTSLLPKDFFEARYWTSERGFGVDTYDYNESQRWLPIPFPGMYHVVLRIMGEDPGYGHMKETQEFDEFLPRSELNQSEAVAFTICVQPNKN